MRWSEDTTVKFVGLYKDCECLWDCNNANYRNKNLREAAYTKIVNEMGLDGFGVQEAKQKVKNLQSTYSQELKKIEVSKKTVGEDGETYTPSVKWFTTMDSILRNVKKASSKSKVEPCEILLTDIKAEELDDTPRIIPCEVSIHEIEEDFSPKPKRMKTTNEDSNIGQAFQFMKTLTDMVSNRDEYTVYGEHLANRLRNCGRSKLEVAIAQHCIDEVCFKLTMGGYFQESLSGINSFQMTPLSKQNHSFSDA
ncbi:uncharacterized protein [Halyomorpha halys]|uniref:uncharacterized protein n=1 Tax=Halyomorpha halys TaxID=286706 RepID=UPI0006D51BD7|nr:uncharacterized protein LOC106678734 [Halyomorpha halys]